MLSARIECSPAAPMMALRRMSFHMACNMLHMTRQELPLTHLTQKLQHYADVQLHIAIEV